MEYSKGDVKTQNTEAASTSYMDSESDRAAKGSQHLTNAGLELLGNFGDNIKSDVTAAGMAVHALGEMGERVVDHMMNNPRATAELGFPVLLITDGSLTGRTSAEIAQQNPGSMHVDARNFNANGAESQKFEQKQPGVSSEQNLQKSEAKHKDIIYFANQML